MRAIQQYRFVFFGTPRFAARVLDSLERAKLLPALVVTAPDRKAGRGQKLTPSPVKVWAQERGIDVLELPTLKGELPPELVNTEWDFFVVAAYAKLIPKTLLDLPRKGVLNVHPSLLPKFRGPSPVLSAILADERETGISIMLLDEELDHGPIIAQAKVEIAPEDWPVRGSMLEDMLSSMGGDLLAEAVPLWMKDELPAEEQNHAQATHTRKFTDEDARLDLTGDPYQNLLKIRAFDKNPRAYFLDGQGKRVIVTDATIEDGVLKILSVIPEGKKEMPFEMYSRT